MKTNSKIRKRSLFAGLGVIFVIVLTMMGQRAEQTDNQSPVIIKTPNKQVKARVVAIRRVNLLLRDPGPKGITDEDRRPYVEIELYVGEPDFNTQLAHLVQIGDREFVVNSWNPSDERYNAALLLPALEFEELMDGAEIYFRAGTMIPRETFTKLYDEGKFTGDHGLNAGRLDKKMIDLEPTVERRAGWTPPQ